KQGARPKQIQMKYSEPTESEPKSSVKKPDEVEKQKEMKGEGELVKQVQFPSKILHFTFYNYCPKYFLVGRPITSMALVLYWPGEKCKRTECALPVGTPFVKEGFFLHGYWPQSTGNNNMLCCQTKTPLSLAEKIIFGDDTLKDLIYRNWMSISVCAVSLYQYDKHGSCAQKIFEGPNGIKDYMRTTIALYQKYNLWKILQESELQVVTNKLYNIEQLKKVLRREIGCEVIFTCVEMTSIFDVKMCFDPNSNPFNPTFIKCPDKNYREEKRRCSKEVMFEEFPKYLLDPVTSPRNNCPY
ncbi:hypothetical protein EIN_299020, partial [Entamoeba invadens IP1]